MAIYHCSIGNVSRAKGASACATLAYITGEKTEDERLGRSFSYGRQERVVETDTLIPDFAPEELRDAKRLFNSIEKYEKSETARTAKKIEVALPVECNLEEQRNIIRAFIENNLTSKGYCATYAIHEDKEGINPHAHILVANRPIDEKTQTWAKTKTTKEYVLDGDGKRVPVIDPETGEQKIAKRNERLWQRRTVSQNPLDRKDTLKDLRHSWAVECNKYLGVSQKIDERSYEAQGLDIEPTIHEGYVSREIEARGGVSERMEINREIRERNRLLESIKEHLKDLGDKIKDLTKEKTEYVRELLHRSRLDRGDRETERRELQIDGDNQISKRADREDERERLAVEEKRRVEERKRKAITRSIGRGGPDPR